MEEAEAIGSRLLAALARDVGRRAGIAAGPRDPTGDDDRQTSLTRLTRREREVLGLLGSGATNRQIAAELYISTKTASVHVSASWPSWASTPGPKPPPTPAGSGTAGRETVRP